TYLLVRPALRRALGQTEPTEWETRFLKTMRERAPKRTAAEMFPEAKNSPAQRAGVETIFTALFLALDDAPGKVMSPATQQAFDRLWSMQVREGKERGAWPFFQVDLDPWETNGESPYFGATLAAVAIASTSADYRKPPEIRERIADLAAYL